MPESILPTVVPAPVSSPSPPPTWTDPAPGALPHFLRLAFDARELAASFGRRFADRSGRVDLGYRVHCRLAALFGDHAPAAFHVEEHGERLVVTAWSKRDAWTLREIAERRAEKPEIERSYVEAPWHSTSRAGSLAWRADHAFDVRVCPVVRRSRDGVELDALEHARADDPEAARPADVYLAWLEERLETAGVHAADLSLVGRDLVHLHRRGRPGRRGRRRGRWLRRPAVHVRGRLVDPDPEALARLLVQGLGRHRAFGFGLLRPASAGPGEPS